MTVVTKQEGKGVKERKQDRSMDMTAKGGKELLQQRIVAAKTLAK